MAVTTSRTAGPAGLIAKIVVLSLTAALAVWAAVPLVGAGAWPGVAVVAVVTAILFYVYLSPKRLPAKYLVPGTLLLLAFQVLPVLYTMSVSVTNFGDGHRGDKADTIAFIEASSVVQVDGSPTYRLTVATDDTDGELVFLLADGTGQWVGDRDGLTELDAATITTAPDGRITTAPGYTPLTGSRIAEYDSRIAELAVPTDGGGIRASGISTAYQGVATRSYDAGCDCITDTATGRTWTADEETGRFVSADGDVLAQGWQVSVGFDNFTRALTDAKLRGPFLGVLVWNILFAAGSVLLTFALGLACAMALHHPRMRGKAVYRAAIVLPYAMPAFAMLLVWRDMFNTDYGLINTLLGLDVPWFGTTWSARGALLLVNLWLGFPYMFLISTGALQAIPSDTLEAARIDGATGFQAWRSITLPLLLVALTPLLISSFAFNFNNFNAIQLTTAGGPFSSDSSTVGGTDLLITYTFRLAFGGQGADYGYASAISIFIFAIVAVISALSFRVTRQHEEVYR